MRTALLPLLVLTVFLVSGVHAQDVADDLEETSEEAKASVLDDVVSGIGNAGEAVADAAKATGEGIGGAAAAVAEAIGAAVRSVGRGAMAAIGATGTAGAWAATGLAGLVAATVKGLASSTGAIGAAAGLVVTILLLALRDAAAALARVIAAAWEAYMGLIDPLRPARMPEGAFRGAAGAGAISAAAATGYAFWPAVKRGLATAAGAFGFGVAGFSRIREEALLEHPLRRRIFETIQQQPGIHASALARDVGSGWGTIVHHLQKLEKARLVATRRVNNQKCFFEMGGEVSRNDMAVASAVKGSTAASIAGLVEHNPMLSQKDVCEALQISPALASFHVKKLVSQGVLERVRHGKAWRLTTSDAFRRVVEHGQIVVPRTVAPARVAA